MIGTLDPYCPTCGGVCKCGVDQELTLATARFLDQEAPLNRFVKKVVFEGNDFPNLLRYYGNSFQRIRNAMQRRIDQE